MQLTPEQLQKQQKKQEHYRDARFTNTYDNIWQSVGKCVFCDLRDKYIFFEEHGVVMTVSLFAYIDGHFMIVPRRHVRSPKELTQLEWDTVRKFTYIAKKLIKDVHGVKGMQLVQKDGANAQSTVDQHLHFHCIPFDAPDLSVWNYRKLTHTPIESAEMYRGAAKKIIKANSKFEDKYLKPAGLPVIVDLVAINERDEVLLVERTDVIEMVPPHWSLPGGRVTDFSGSLEQELVREVREETSLDTKPEALRLVASRISAIGYKRTSEHLKAKYTHHEQIVWNTYVLRGINSDSRLKPGDDAGALHWVPLPEALIHPQLTPDLREAIHAAIGAATNA